MSVVPLSDANQTKEKQESLQMPKPWKCEISTLNERKISLKSANILNRVYVGQARSGHKRSNYVSVNTPDQSSTKCTLTFWKRAVFQPLVLCSMAWPFSSKGKRTPCFLQAGSLTNTGNLFSQFVDVSAVLPLSRRHDTPALGSCWHRMTWEKLRLTQAVCFGPCST